MSVRIACAGCQRQLQIPENLLGKTIKCPRCSTQFVAQAASSPTKPSLRKAAAPAAPARAGARAPATAAPPRRGGGRWVLASILIFGFCCLAAAGGLFAWSSFKGGDALSWLKSRDGGIFTASADWKELAPSGGYFSVSMPGTAAESTVKESQVAEGGSEVHQFLVNGPKDVQYAVHYYDLSEAPPSTYQFMMALKAYAATALNGAKLSGEKEIALKPHPGREYTFELPDNKGALRRAYLTEQRVFLVTVTGPGSVASAPDSKKFFDSFKITGTPPAPRPKTVATGPAPKEPPRDPPREPAKDPKEPKKDPPKETPKEPPAKPPEKPKEPKPPEPDPDKPTFKVSEDEQRCLELLNQLRVKEDAATVKASEKLFQAARQIANQTAKKQGGTIVNKDKWGYQSVFTFQLGGKDLTPDVMFEGLVRSKSSRVSLADEAYTDVGIGISRGADGVIYYMIILAGNPE